MRRFVVSLVTVAMIGATAIAAADEIVMDGSTTVGPIAKAFAEFFMKKNPNVNVTVSESGSGNGAKSLINGTCDIADMSRFMKESEFSAAVESGVYPVAHAVAYDGIAMIVNPSNPVGELSIEQVKAIYLGEITNWSEVGGPDAEILPISRDTNSGTFETFEGLVMDKEKITDGAEVVGSNGQMRQRVQTTQGAVGYVGLGFVDETVKAVKINGVMPSDATIATGDYAIARPLFMFTDGYPKMGSAVHRFITLYLTKQGQEIVKAIGFVPVTEYQQ